MCKTTCLVLTGAIAVAAVGTSLAFAQQSKDGATPSKKTTTTTKQATPPDAPAMPAVPGMSEADMIACAAAATPGPMQAWLIEDAGTWTGKSTMWMTADAPPTVSEATDVVTPMLDGRFIKCDTVGEIPGMGAFNGFALTGFDNVSQKFQSIWADTMGTGMMWGTGTLSSDGKTLTFNYTYNCPMTKKPTVMRMVQTRTGTDTRTMEMWGPDPSTAKEFRMLEIKYKRAPSKTAAKSAE